MRHSIRNVAALLPVAMLISACDGGREYHCYDCDLDPSGIYEGTLTDASSQTGTPAVAVLDENGNGRMATDDGRYFRLSVGTDYSDLFGSYRQFTSGAGSSFAGSLSGQVTQPGLSVHFVPQSSGVTSSDAALNFDKAYLSTSSLPTLAGSWSTASGSSFTFSLDIQSTGAFTGSDSDGCTYSGNFGLVDPYYNAYTESFTQTCGQTSTAFSGQAYYLPASGTGSNAMPAMIHFLADDGTASFISVTVQ